MWAYERLFEKAKLLSPVACSDVVPGTPALTLPNAVATVSDAHFRAGLPFLSIQGTLNHLLASDALWWMRFTGQKAIPGVAVRNDLEPSVAVAPWLLLLCTLMVLWL